MGLQNYIEKLRAKPARERERIAVIATGVAFAVVLVIWLLSFSEMNKNENPESASSPVTNQLEDLKKNIGDDKQSIQDMIESLPQSTDLNSLPSESLPSDGSEDQGRNTNNIQNEQPGIPQLP
jgi:ABC-type antimicrobial peptide transport system permease subunit